MNDLSSMGQACAWVLTDWDNLCPDMFPKTDTYGPPKVVDRLGLSRSSMLLLYFQSGRIPLSLYARVVMLE